MSTTTGHGAVPNPDAIEGNSMPQSVSDELSNKSEQLDQQQSQPPHQQPEQQESNLTDNPSTEYPAKVVPGTDEAQPKSEGIMVENEIPSQHPYEQQLSEFQPLPWQLKRNEPVMYSSIEYTPFTLVNTLPLFNLMLAKLKRSTEFAMDLEHHSYRSFLGIVCIIQISTRQEDFIVDGIELKEEVHRLNEVCTDASILKVLHGSERDVEWLQRDFKVFVVNMFDTQKAARVLQEESIALAHILKKYCNVHVNKRHQLADWRIRPLPEDMLQYAREDAHFLLYIKDVYQNALLKGKDTDLTDVYESSTDICRTFYTEPIFQPDSYLNCYRKIKGKLNVQQMECFRLIYEWRHNISKQHDESPGYTLPNKMLFKIAHDLPEEPVGVVHCCIPMPPLVHENIETIHQLVLQAIVNVPEVPEEDEDDEDIGKPLTPVKKNNNNNAERLWAIKMVNDLFVLQLKLRPELRMHPDASPLLKWERENGVT